MVLPVFPRNIPYRERPKSPPFNFFRHCEKFFGIFFSKFFFLKGSPLHFFDVLRQNGCWKIPKGSSFQFFSALWDFFPKIKKIFFNFFMFCDRMDVEMLVSFNFWIRKSVFKPKESHFDFQWLLTTTTHTREMKSSAVQRSDIRFSFWFGENGRVPHSLDPEF